MEKQIKQLLKVIKLNEDTLSMVFGVITVLLVGILAFRMYRTNKPAITETAETTISSPAPTATLGDVKVSTLEDGTIVPTDLPETYTVAKGEHLWGIAEKLYGSGYNWVDIAKENGIKNGSQIEVGQELKIAKTAVRMTVAQKVEMDAKLEASKDNAIDGDTYTVAKGDSLWKISVRAYADGYKWTEVAKANNISILNSDRIEVGMELKLPR